MRHNSLESSGELLSRELVRDLITLGGQAIRVSTEDLSLRDRDGLQISVKLRGLLDQPSVARPLFTLLTDLLVTHSLSYARTSVTAIMTWLSKARQIEQVELEHLNNISGSGLPQSYAAFILATLHRWERSHLPGLSEDVCEFLRSGDAWEERGSGSYFILLTNDPERGALTDQELHSLHFSLNKGHAEGLVSLEDFVLVWFFIATGLRPIQAHRMTLADVIVSPGPEGREVTLLVPLAKGEGVPRTEKWKRRAPTVLADCLIRYLGLPAIQSRRREDRLFGFQTSDVLSKRVTSVLESLDTWSDRLESRIPMSPYRFRYTLATRALAHGASDHEVARLLTHRRTTCIAYYRASMPALQRPIAEKLGPELKYIARAFQGRLINDLEQATRSGEADALVLDFLRLSGRAVGACGTRTECHLHAPIACLTCHYFEPFRDAPWDDLLAWLEDDRNREPEQRVRDINVAAISAVMEIKAACGEVCP